MGRSGAAIGHDEARLSEEWRTSLFWVVLNLNPAIWEAIAGTGALGIGPIGGVWMA